MGGVLTLKRRYMDTTRPRLRDSQVVHLSASAADCGCDSEGGQDVTRMGLEYWEEAGNRPVCKEAEGCEARRYGSQYERYRREARVETLDGP